MDENEEFKNYIEDCLLELIERAKEASNKNKETDRKNMFYSGVSFGYYAVLSFLFNQAEAFGIKDKMTRLPKDFNPDQLLSLK